MKFYYLNHLGERIDLDRSPYILAEHNLFNWVLSYTTVNNKSSNIRLKSVERSMTIRLMPKAATGSVRAAMFTSLYDHFVDVISADNETPGKLYTDTGEYIECRIIASEKSNWNLDRNVNIACRVLIDYPKWQKPTTYTLDLDDDPGEGSEDQDTYEFLDYPYDYEYDYKGVLPANRTIENDGTETADYIVTIYGPVSNPILSIGELVIGAYVTLGQNERLVISSKDKTVIKYMGDVAKNMFNYRVKGPKSMFGKLPVGESIVWWSGVFKAEITVLSERLEPSWN